MTQIAPHTTAGAGSSPSGQYLTFMLGAEEYGIDVLKVQEINGYTNVTPIPGTPPHVKGVINLRGVIIPVIDLRARLGLDPAEYNKFTVIMVLIVGGRSVGLVVDMVSDVVDIAANDVQLPSQFGGSSGGFLTGMAKMGERLVVLLDVDALVSVGSLGAV